MNHRYNYEDYDDYAAYQAHKRKLELEKFNNDLTERVQSKRGRTAVFAGHARPNVTAQVPKLEQLCLKVLARHIDDIQCVGDASYDMLKSILKKCDANQLAKFERFNPRFIQDTNDLWKELTRDEFKNAKVKPSKGELWRDIYFRLMKEREDKLKKITKHINDKKAKQLPVRTTQKAFTGKHEQPKPPKEVIRQRQKAVSTGCSSTSNAVKLAPQKPKVAPLMKKTLMMYKKTQRR